MSAAPPKSYRVYCFDIERRSVSADFINAVSDEDAIAMTRARCVSAKCEIFEGKRLVAQLERKDARA